MNLCYSFSYVVKCPPSYMWPPRIYWWYFPLSTTAAPLRTCLACGEPVPHSTGSRCELG